MKKLFTTLSVILGLGLASAQQVAPKTATATKPAKVQKMQPVKTTMTAKAEKPTVAKPAQKMTSTKPATTNSAIKLKKDGTPDKRYKANEHLKKDGTPDKRYKTK